jgi:hypothetical protein
MADAAILYYEPRKTVSEFEGERQKEEVSASRDERAQHVKNEFANKSNGPSESQDSSQSSMNELRRLVNEVIDKLGPLSDEEAKLIRQWLELGS